MHEEQHALAEAALAEAVARHPHQDGTAAARVSRPLPPQLQERYEQLMGFAKNPNWKLTALENLASARELVDTAFTLGAIDDGSHQAYIVETNIAKREAMAGVVQRAVDARSRQ